MPCPWAYSFLGVPAWGDVLPLQGQTGLCKAEQSCPYAAQRTWGQGSMEELPPGLWEEIFLPCYGRCCPGREMGAQSLNSPPLWILGKQLELLQEATGCLESYNGEIKAPLLAAIKAVS